MKNKIVEQLFFAQKYICIAKQLFLEQQNKAQKISKNINASNYQLAKTNNDYYIITNLNYELILSAKINGDNVQINYFNLKKHIQSIASCIKRNTTNKYNDIISKVRTLYFFEKRKVDLESRLLNTIKQYVSKALVQQYTQHSSVLDEFITKKQTVTKQQAYKIFVYTYNSSRAIIKRWLGNDIQDLLKEKVNQFQVMFSFEEQRQDKKLKQDSIDALKEINNYIDNRCKYGEIQFVKDLDGGSDLYGDYIIQSDSIRIKLMNKRKTKFTLLHELAHRLWYKFLSQSQKNQISKLFNNAKRGENLISKKIIYLDRQCTIIKFNNRTRKTVIRFDDNNEQLQLMFPLPENIIDRLRQQQKYIYPTDYSKIDEIQFFAQCYACYYLQPNAFNNQTKQQFYNILTNKFEENKKQINKDKIVNIQDKNDEEIKNYDYLSQKNKNKLKIKKVLFLDAKNKQTKQVEISMETFDDIRKLLGCEWVQRINLGSSYYLYVDQDGLSKQYQYGFKFNAHPHIMFGNGVISKQGNSKLTLEFIQDKIQFCFTEFYQPQQQLPFSKFIEYPPDVVGQPTLKEIKQYEKDYPQWAQIYKNKIEQKKILKK